MQLIYKFPSDFPPRGLELRCVRSGCVANETDTKLGNHLFLYPPIGSAQSQPRGALLMLAGGRDL